jgi:hypothetical protein
MSEFGKIRCKVPVYRRDAEGAKKRYFSFAVERTAKEKNQSLRDIFRL